VRPFFEVKRNFIFKTEFFMRGVHKMALGVRRRHREGDELRLLSAASPPDAHRPGRCGSDPEREGIRRTVTVFHGRRYKSGPPSRKKTYSCPPRGSSAISSENGQAYFQGEKADFQGEPSLASEKVILTHAVI